MANLLCTCLVCKRYGTLLSVEKLGSLGFVFLTLSKTLSCARCDTSYQVLPSLSTISKIPIMLSATRFTVENCCGWVNINCWVLIVAEIAVVDFFNKNLVGSPVPVSIT